MARRAEASSTQLRSPARGIGLAFSPGLGPPLGDELVRKADSGGDVCEAPAQPLEHGITLFQHKALIFHQGDEDVSRSDSQLAADLGRDHETALGPNRNFG